MFVCRPPSPVPRPLAALLLPYGIGSDLTPVPAPAPAAAPAACPARSATDAGLQVSYYRPGYPDSLAKDDVYVFTPEQIGAPRDFLLYPNYANGSTFIYPVRAWSGVECVVLCACVARAGLGLLDALRRGGVD